MKQTHSLHWSDIKSDLYRGKEYIDHIQKKRSKLMYQSNYKAYTPDEKILKEIKQILERSNQKYKILTLGASWCSTCAQVKSALIKIIEQINSSQMKIYLLGGAKTKLNSETDKIEWVAKSPPEFNNPKFAVSQIPMVYIFDQSGKCIKMIEKSPNNSSNYEEAILKVLNQ